MNISNLPAAKKAASPIIAKKLKKGSAKPPVSQFPPKK